MEGEDIVPDRRLDVELLREEGDGGKVDRRDHEEGGADKLELEGALDILLAAHGLEVRGDEGGEEADNDADGGDRDGEDHGVPPAGEADVGADDEGGAGGLGKGADEVGAQSVTSPTLPDGGGVAWVVLGDAVHHLSDEVGADVGGLGADAAADAAKHSQQYK